MATLVNVNRDGACGICQRGFSVSDEQFSNENKGGEAHGSFHKTCLTQWLVKGSVKGSVCPIRTKDIDSGPLLSPIQQMTVQPGRVFIRVAYSTSFSVLTIIIGAAAGAVAGGVAGELAKVTARAAKLLVGASYLKELAKFAEPGLLEGGVVGLSAGLIATAASAATFSGEVAKEAEKIGPGFIVRAAAVHGLSIGLSLGGVSGGGLAAVPFFVSGMNVLFGK